MNDILSLTGSFQQQKNSQRPGKVNLPGNSEISSTKIQSLINDLKEMQSFWGGQKIISKCLISAYYCRNIAKSNRIKAFFGSKPDSLIVGSKFDKDLKHIITYLVSKDLVQKTILDATAAVNILDEYFNGIISSDQFNQKDGLKKIDFKKQLISESKFRKFVVDAWFVEKFDVETATFTEVNNTIVSFYNVDEEIPSILKKIGIKTYNNRFLDDRTVLMDTGSIKLLLDKAPFLVSMATTDMAKMSPSDFDLDTSESHLTIPAPGNEPTIGVIDTLFDENVYFQDWVEYSDMLDSSIKRKDQDYYHGTEVSSIIVDGATLNPLFDDGCGRFKVKHFGVSIESGFSSFSIIKNIRIAVEENPDIHVWNISLGSDAEVNRNFISAEGAELDEIQYERNVVFVIAGTNKQPGSPQKRIGAPADSVNSIVVNSVNDKKAPASYSREGIVLSFFTKPDISYYGGDLDSPMKAYCPKGIAFVRGTSFAAPWIARKMAYLIDILGLSREVAKALIIDSAIGWREKNQELPNISLLGNGVVPVRIEDIVKCQDDEIKFTIEGKSEKWNTYNYQIPVPIVNEKYPYIAKATLCYFPKCSRNQGVDYTNTELDIKFGRLKEKNGKPVVESINNDTQSDSYSYVTEKEARKRFRKWDNVKNISEVIKTRPRPKKVYQDTEMWGIDIKSTGRLNNTDGKNLRFGLLITLKEINGKNRIDDFIQRASFKEWRVKHIRIKNRIEIYNEASEDINLE